MPPLSIVLNQVFLDGLGHEAPLDSLLKILMKNISQAKSLCTRVANSVESCFFDENLLVTL